MASPEAKPKPTRFFNIVLVILVVIIPLVAARWIMTNVALDKYRLNIHRGSRDYLLMTKDVIQDKDGNLVFIGSGLAKENKKLRKYRIIVSKVGRNYKTIWTRAYPGLDSANAIHIKLGEDDHYHVWGSTRHNNSNKSQLIYLKLDKQGKLLKRKIFAGNKYTDYDQFVFLSDGKIISKKTKKSQVLLHPVSIQIATPVRDGRFFYVQVSAKTGTHFKWKTRLPLGRYPTSKFASRKLDSGGCYIMMQDSSKYNTLYIFKLDNMGKIVWQHTYWRFPSPIFVARIKIVRNQGLVVHSWANLVFFYLDKNGRRVTPRKE